MSDDETYCYKVTGTDNEGVLVVHRCIHCDVIGNVCMKFNGPIVSVRGADVPEHARSAFLPKCDGRGVQRVEGVSK